MKPLAIDLFCGLGGWTEGLLAEGYRVVGFDIERHRYPKYRAVNEDHAQKSPIGSMFGQVMSDRVGATPRDMAVQAMRASEPTEGWQEYPAQLVLQDVLTIHGSQFKDAALIVASPPCQAYSYRAMPWKRAKALPPPDNSLFEACFRIQREACEAAGRFIPLVVENVRGAQPWVGRSRWHYGSFHLWGDVPALMPLTKPAVKVGGIDFSGYGTPGYKAVAFNGTAESRWKGEHGGWFNDNKRKGGTETGRLSRSGSKSSARKAASAHIAKIPLPLARHIARAWHPEAL